MTAVDPLATTDVPLPRLPQTQADWWQLQLWWQQVVELIERQLAKINEAIARLEYITTTQFGAVVSKTADYTATDADRVILVDASGGAVTITLPGVSSTPLQMFDVIKIDSSANAVNVASTSTINGDTGAEITIQWTSLTFIAASTGWVIR